MFACRYPPGTKFITSRGNILTVESIHVTSNVYLVYGLYSSKKGSTFYWGEDYLDYMIKKNSLVQIEEN